MIRPSHPEEAELAVPGRFIEFDLPKPPGEECGVIAICLTEQGEQDLYDQGVTLPHLLYEALKKQQHRGQHNSGIGTSVDGWDMQVITGAGTPEKVFNNGARLKELPERGRFGLAQNRYTTQGGPNGAQPTWFSTRLGAFSLSHNGEFSSIKSNRGEQPSDTWVWASIVADFIDEGMNAPDAMIKATKLTEGAYSITAFNNGEIIGMRDPNGIRPLVLGRLGSYGWMLASEKPTLESVGADYLRDVRNGELVIIGDNEGPRSFQYANAPLKECSLEEVYLSSPEDPAIHRQRYENGRLLAQQFPVDADIVVPILDSGKVGALGYAHELEIPYVEAIEKVGKERAFMAAEEARRAVVFGKHIIHTEMLQDLRVVFVDDSIVRGDTFDVLGDLVSPLVREMHVRVLSPPVIGVCNKGVAIARGEELIANQKSKDEFQRQIGADSLEYQPKQNMEKVHGPDMCTECFDHRAVSAPDGSKLLPVLQVTH